MDALHRHAKQLICEELVSRSGMNHSYRVRCVQQVQGAKWAQRNEWRDIRPFSWCRFDSTVGTALAHHALAPSIEIPRHAKEIL